MSEHTSHEPPPSPPNLPPEAAPFVHEHRPLLAPRIEPRACTSCASEREPAGFVYAVGRLAVDFPDPSLQHEFDAQARELGVLNSEGADYKVLSARGEGTTLKNLYLAELARWLLTVDRTPVFSLIPRSRLELEDMIEALKPEGRERRMVVAIGPTLPSQGDDDLERALANKIYYGTIDDQIQRLAKAASADLVRLVFQILAVESTPGDTPEQRAKNYLAFTSRELYRKTTQLAEEKERKNLVRASTSASNTGGARNVIDVTFSYETNDREESKWRIGVDVTGQFPFVASPLQRSYQ